MTKRDIDEKVQEVRESRFCPPDWMLSDPKHAEQVKVHLSECFSCRQARAGLTHAAEAVLEKLGPSLVEVCREPKQQVSSGQVYLLSDKLGGWTGQGRHLNPPQVMVLDSAPSTGGRYLVVQVCGDPALQGGGDVELNDFLGFAEVWNTYRIAASHLGRLTGEAEAACVVAVLKEMRQARRRVSVEPDLADFRAMEKAVGRQVERQSRLDWLLDLLPTPERLVALLADRFRSWVLPEGLVERLRSAGPVDELQELLWEAFASARPQGGAVPARGKDTDAIVIAANIITIGKDQLSPRSVLIGISSWEWQDQDRLSVIASYQVRETGVVGAAETWWTADGRPPVAGRAELDPEAGNLFLFFTGIERSEPIAGRLSIALVVYA